ncbi:hypothetical protein HDU67_005186, partial [Dinochytrium kinnereticum]
KRIPKLRFDTPLDDVLGVATIPVYPPVQDGVLAVKRFRRLMNRDRKAIFRAANLREIEIVWKSLASFSPATTGSVRLFPPFNDASVIKALETASAQDFGLAKENVPSHSILDHRLLSPAEAERLVTYIIGEIGSRIAREVAGQPDKPNQIKLIPEDVALGMRTFTSGVTAANAVHAGIEFAGIFANPRDLLTLSNHEQRLLNQCLIKPEKMSTTFGNIGGLAKTKGVINELIRLPLLKPELFSFGVLKQSTTGILLFGPPGTGKTMLARAVAAESGANFLNVQMSSVQSMWVGENEKNVKALFSLARKLRPCVIFVDEIDALLR